MEHATVVMPEVIEPVIVMLKGGPGSGHRGHGGRPGKRGGSLPGVGRAPGRPLGSWGPGLGGTEDIADKRASDMLSQEIRILPGTIYVDLEAWEKPMHGEAGRVKQDLIANTVAHSNEVLKEHGLSETNTEEINTAVKQWAYTGNDNDMRSLSLQEAATEEFGLKMSDWQKGKSTEIRAAVDVHRAAWEEKWGEDKLVRFYTKMRDDRLALGRPMPAWLAKDPSEETMRKKARQMARDNPFVAPAPNMQSLTSRARERAILRGMYNNTQEKLKDAGYGPNDTVKLFRGVQFGTEDPKLSGKSVNYKGNAMESWSVSKTVAGNFGSPDLGEYGVTLGIEVPVRNVMSTARSGFGCLSEGEFVIFGNISGTKVSVEETFHTARTGW